MRRKSSWTRRMRGKQLDRKDEGKKQLDKKDEGKTVGQEG